MIAKLKIDIYLVDRDRENGFTPFAIVCFLSRCTTPIKRSLTRIHVVLL